MKTIDARRGGQGRAIAGTKYIFFIIRKIKMINIKREYKNEKQSKREGSNYVSKVMLKFIISNIDF